MKLKVRCPHCAKLYEVESEEILSDLPLFQCVSCESRFGFEYPPADPQQVEAFLVSSSTQAQSANTDVAPQQESGADRLATFASDLKKDFKADLKDDFKTDASGMKPCPKCGALNGRRSSECYSCHVIFERLEGLPQDASLRAQPSLVRKWKNLLENFENEALHDEFIRSCRELDALRFATMKYEELKTAQGGDHLCDQMIKKIEGLMMVSLAQNSKPQTGMNFSRIKSNWITSDWMTSKKWRKCLFWGPYSLSALLILWGILSLGHRNLIGIGVALACMTSGIIVMIKGKISLSDFID